jgi:hypothetical protein
MNAAKEEMNSSAKDELEVSQLGGQEGAQFV